MNVFEADLMSLEMDMLNMDYEHEFVEAGIYDTTTAFTNFIKKIINKMKYYIQQVKIDVSALAQKRQLKKRLKDFQKSLKQPGAPRTIKLPDFEGAVRTYEKGFKNLERGLEKLMRYNCKSYKDVDKFCDRADNLIGDIDELADKIEGILNDPYLMKPDEAIQYLDEVLSGKAIYTQYISMIRKISQFENRAHVSIANKCLDTQNISRAHNKMQSTLTKISAKTSKIVRRLIMKICFWFS